MHHDHDVAAIRAHVPIRFHMHYEVDEIASLVLQSEHIQIFLLVWHDAQILSIHRHVLIMLYHELLQIDSDRMHHLCSEESTRIDRIENRGGEWGTGEVGQGQCGGRGDHYLKCASSRSIKK